MRKSALLVLPSRAESFGAVLVEALACGTPVVATRCGGPEDIVSDEVGTLVPPEDENALAEGIGRILQRRGMYNPERLRTYALERFSWERVANDTVNVYQQALQFGSPQ
jgi:glycosyltransferase involved in cell wall biosynthesis